MLVPEGRDEKVSVISNLLRTGSPDINESTVVGEGSLGVSDGSGTDGDGGGGAGRGVIDNVRIVVTGSDDGGDTGGDEIGGGSVNGGEVTAAQAQGSNRRATAASGSFSNPVNSGNAVWNVNVSPKDKLLVKEKRTYQPRYRICRPQDSDRRTSRIQIGYTPVIAEDLDGNDLGRLGDTTVGRVRHLIRKHSVRQQGLTMDQRQQYQHSGCRDYTTQ